MNQSKLGKRVCLTTRAYVFDKQDSLASLQPGGIHYLRSLLDEDGFLLDSQSLDGVLSSLQVIDDKETIEIVDRLIEKLLQGVLHFTKRPTEEMCRLLTNILLILAQRSPHLSQHQTLAALRILLNCTNMLPVNSAEVVRLYEQLALKVGLGMLLNVFQGIYNEVKFTVSVTSSYLRSEMERKISASTRRTLLR